VFLFKNSVRFKFSLRFVFIEKIYNDFVNLMRDGIFKLIKIQLVEVICLTINLESFYYESSIR